MRARSTAKRCNLPDAGFDRHQADQLTVKLVQHRSYAKFFVLAAQIGLGFGLR